MERPGHVPEVFAPGLISNPETYEFGSVFSQDGMEFFFAIDRGGKAEILTTKWSESGWLKPSILLGDDLYGYNDPMLSINEDRLYFISDHSADQGPKSSDIDIWYIEKDGEGWSQPINAGDAINTNHNEYYVSFAADGSMYFSSNKDPYNFDIYRSQFVNGEFRPSEKLPSTINTDQYEADVYVSPEETYMIFCSTRNEGFGQGDLYISFRKSDGMWTEAINMGPPINNEHHQLCPFVTRDGKYLFYTSNRDIYWVSASVIDQYRK